MTGSIPRVTLVTPTFNQADFLAETIESVLAQSYANIEYLVIDDGSTDGTRAVLERYDGRIRWRSQANAGQARTLNSGWDAATGCYLGYLSSDDILYPTAVEELVAALEQDRGRVCAFPDASLIDIDSRVVRKNVCRPFDLAALVVEQECYIGPGALFRRDAYISVGGWRADLRLAPDREFWMRLAREGQFHFHPASLAGYRIHPDSISYKVVSEEASLEYLRVLDDYFSGEVGAGIAQRRDEAYGRAHFLIARNCYRALAFKVGNQHYRLARDLHPPLGSLASRLLIARTVVSKPVRVGVARVRQMAGRL